MHDSVLGANYSQKLMPAGGGGTEGHVNDDNKVLVASVGRSSAARAWEIAPLSLNQSWGWSGEAS